MLSGLLDQVLLQLILILLAAKPPFSLDKPEEVLVPPFIVYKKYHNFAKMLSRRRLMCEHRIRQEVELRFERAERYVPGEHF